jgi:hypothetical protein
MLDDYELKHVKICEEDITVHLILSLKINFKKMEENQNEIFSNPFALEAVHFYIPTTIKATCLHIVW